MADEISKTGLWVDDDTGKLVTKQPARSTQIAREGELVTAEAQARIDALKADPDAKPISAAEALGNEPVKAEPAKKVPVTKAPAKRAPRK